MTDEQIIDRVRGGEVRLFEELVRRHQDQVYGMAVRLVGRSGDAEDLAQEAFLKAFRGLEGFKGDAKFSTWLYRITWNLCADWLRRRRAPGERAASIDEAAEVADGRIDVAAAVLDGETRDQVRNALDGLPEKYRAVVTLLYYQKMSYDQISAVLGLPVKTIETRLYRARRMLRDALDASERRSGQ